MIFVFPFIFGAAIAGLSVAGAAKGAKGIKKMKKAKKIANSAQERHELAVSQFEVDCEATNKLAEEYGQLQINILSTTVRRFVAFIERNGQQVSQSDIQILEGLEIPINQINEYKAATIEAQQLLTGGAQTLALAAAGYYSAIGLASTIGVASTGTAISTLSGAAATNATLAWLGGGSLAAGGGGMALGSLVLGGISLGPAIMLGGFALAAQGKKAKRQAREYEADVNIAIAKIGAAKDYLQQVKRQLIEKTDLIKSLNSRAVLSLDELVSQPFDREKDAIKFQQVALLIKSLFEIIKTPVLDT